MMTAAIIAVVSLVGTPAQAGTRIPGSPATAVIGDGADIAVDLFAVGGVLLPSARYTVTVTNHGPATATSVVVTVQLDSRAYSVPASPCTYNPAVDTVTCTFGAVPPGGTGTVMFWTYFALNNFDVVWATATRTASTPADPNGDNDADSTQCQWWRVEGLPSMSRMTC